MKGFTLLEFIIVLAIIGILAFIAIPAYCNYTVPARVSKAVAMAEPVKIAISEYYQNYKTLPEASVLANKLDANKTEYLESVNYLKYSLNSAAIVYQFNQKLTGIPTDANHRTLILKVTVDVNGKLSWDCRGGDLPSLLRPKICRRES